VEGGPRAEEEVACHDVVLGTAEGIGREEEGSIGGRDGSYQERLGELVPMLSGGGRAQVLSKFGRRSELGVALRVHGSISRVLNSNT